MSIVNASTNTTPTWILHVDNERKVVLVSFYKDEEHYGIRTFPFANYRNSATGAMNHATNFASSLRTRSTPACAQYVHRPVTPASTPAPTPVTPTPAPAPASTTGPMGSRNFLTYDKYRKEWVVYYYVNKDREGSVRFPIATSNYKTARLNALHVLVWAHNTDTRPTYHIQHEQPAMHVLQRQ